MIREIVIKLQVKFLIFFLSYWVFEPRVPTSSVFSTDRTLRVFLWFIIVVYLSGSFRKTTPFLNDSQIQKKNFQKNFDKIRPFDYPLTMKKLSIIVAGSVTILGLLYFLPPYLVYLIGCFSIGWQIGGYIYDKIEEEQ